MEQPRCLRDKVELEGQTGRAPIVRSLDGAVCVLLCVGLKTCRLLVVLLRRATCRICKGGLMPPMKVVIQ